jgi:hypothetical protein
MDELMREIRRMLVESSRGSMQRGEWEELIRDKIDRALHEHGDREAAKNVKRAKKEAKKRQRRIDRFAASAIVATFGKVQQPEKSAWEIAESMELIREALCARAARPAAPAVSEEPEPAGDPNACRRDGETEQSEPEWGTAEGTNGSTKIPLNARAWDIFYNKAGAEEAARELTETLRRALKAPTREKAINMMSRVMKKHSALGARDTEPRTIAECALSNGRGEGYSWSL